MLGNGLLFAIFLKTPFLSSIYMKGKFLKIFKLVLFFSTVGNTYDWNHYHGKGVITFYPYGSLWHYISIKVGDVR